MAASGQEPERIAVAVSAAWGHAFDNSGILMWSALAIPFQVNALSFMLQLGNLLSMPTAPL